MDKVTVELLMNLIVLYLYLTLPLKTEYILRFFIKYICCILTKKHTSLYMKNCILNAPIQFVVQF